MLFFFFGGVGISERGGAVFSRLGRVIWSRRRDFAGVFKVCLAFWVLVFVGF